MSTERQQRAREWLRSDSGQPRVKLCGMFRMEDVDAVAQAQPDLCGFIVDFPKSHRSITPKQLFQLGEHLLEYETAGMICNGGVCRMPHTIYRVGVFVDYPMDALVGLVRQGSVDLVQLHGSETNAYVEELRERTGVGVIQAFRVRDPSDVQRAEASLADMVLLDNGQGTGRQFDWSLVSAVRRPFMLAGGLGPENVAQAIEEVRPWGVDMSSGVETDKLKDSEKMATAVEVVRASSKRWCS
jgi:phosphoribosylanthranilate isomerase